eukprot:scaffold3664_cov407-Prasinococcus_capsulatus_cf.AAC.16
MGQCKAGRLVELSDARGSIASRPRWLKMAELRGDGENDVYGDRNARLYFYYGDGNYVSGYFPLLPRSPALPCQRLLETGHFSWYDPSEDVYVLYADDNVVRSSRNVYIIGGDDLYYPGLGLISNVTSNNRVEESHYVAMVGSGNVVDEAKYAVTVGYAPRMAFPHVLRTARWSRVTGHLVLSSVSECSCPRLWRTDGTFAVAYAHPLFDWGRSNDNVVFPGSYEAYLYGNDLNAIGDHVLCVGAHKLCVGGSVEIPRFTWDPTATDPHQMSTVATRKEIARKIVPNVEQAVVDARRNSREVDSAKSDRKYLADKTRKIKKSIKALLRLKPESAQ